MHFIYCTHMLEIIIQESNSTPHPELVSRESDDEVFDLLPRKSDEYHR